jgi:two-component system chemotaxis response regulator CheB
MPTFSDSVAAPLKVLIVDDSAVTRRMLADVLGEDAGVEVVGQASNGISAMQQIERLKPDVITLDVEMPEMDGMETLRQIRELHRGMRVLMFSNLTERGAPVTLKALMNGASDYCPKPQRSRSAEESRDYLRRELLPRVKQFAGGLVARRRPLIAEPDSETKRAGRTPQAVAIGVSTGGPQALERILPLVPKDFHLPILIVQHMPAMFTRLLAQRLSLESKIGVAEASDGQEVRAGQALIAPGGYHMRVKRRGTGVVTTLDQEPLENSCRPAVDVLFRSVAEVWGGNVLAAILTGMGRDGLGGAQVLKQQGAWLLAQDEASSVVWGMPGAVAQAGLADEVVNLDHLVPAILKRSGYRA